MSFASTVKAELCRAQISRKCCALAECYGVLLYSNTFCADQIRIVTESGDFAQRLPRLFRRAFGFAFDVLPQCDGGKQTFLLTDRDKLRRIFDSYGLSPTDYALHVNFGVLENDCCRVAFLRGAFLAGGSVTDPEKRYHLELVTGHIKVSAETQALMTDMDLAVKATTRSGSRVLYFKQGERIEDFLTLLGAPVSAMDMMQARMEKELRNGVNRRVNCEMANLSKVVEVAQDQIAAIRLLEQSGRLTSLPEKLQQAARLRQEHPEATLSELAAMTEPPSTKSAMNHRMRKIMKFAKS